MQAYTLRETALADAHRSLGGKLVDFGGWFMPLNYGSQIEEHNTVRAQAGVFDVSHMTVIDVSGADAENFLRYLLANDVARLPEGKALYSVMLNEHGGVIDDLIVYRLQAHYRLVVNCATREKDLAWLAQCSESYKVAIQERDDLGILAIQGPQAREQVHKIITDSGIRELEAFYATEPTSRSNWLVARTGYTGEDGYEIIMPSSDLTAFWQSLLDQGVKPCGLAARDTLRLEAGMSLYGQELDETHSPLVSNLSWTVAWQPESRQFIGRAALEAERASGAKSKLVGLVLKEKGVLRAGQVVSHPDFAIEGVVTSGTFSPTLGLSIALARVPLNFTGTCQVRIRKRVLAADIVKPNFVRQGKKLI